MTKYEAETLKFGDRVMLLEEHLLLSPGEVFLYIKPECQCDLVVRDEWDNRIVIPDVKLAKCGYCNSCSRCKEVRPDFEYGCLAAGHFIFLPERKSCFCWELSDEWAREKIERHREGEDELP